MNKKRYWLWGGLICLGVVLSSFFVLTLAFFILFNDGGGSFSFDNLTKVPKLFLLVVVNYRIWLIISFLTGSGLGLIYGKIKYRN